MCSISTVESPMRSATMPDSCSQRGDVSINSQQRSEPSEQRDDKACRTRIQNSNGKTSLSLSIPNNIPFSKTFNASESYHSSKADAEKYYMKQSIAAATTSELMFLDDRRPLRRRARSSEGMMLRTTKSDEFHHRSCDDDDDDDDDDIVRPFETLAFFSPQQGQKKHEPDFLYPQNKQNVASSKLRQRRKSDQISHLMSLTNTKQVHNTSSRKRVSPKQLSRKQNYPQKHTRSHHHHQQRFKQHKRSKSPYVIPLEHPFRLIWDIMTVILSIAHGYFTHVAIRDRKFNVSSPFIAFCDVWFFIDILLNFITERKTNTGEILSDHRSIIARYLTSWFAVDALSLFPWEVLYIQPIIELQNRRNIIKKSFFRSKAAVRVTRHLRQKHFRWFGTVAKHTKQHGIGGQRLLRLIIKYVPKYFMFIRNMKGIVAMRILRFVHWFRRFMKNIGFVRVFVYPTTTTTSTLVLTQQPDNQKSDASTKSITTRDDDDDDMLLEENSLLLSHHDEDDDCDVDDDSIRNKSVQLVYENWEMMQTEYDDDDDGVPL